MVDSTKVPVNTPSLKSPPKMRVVLGLFLNFSENCANSISRSTKG